MMDFILVAAIALFVGFIVGAAAICSQNTDREKYDKEAAETRKKQNDEWEEQRKHREELYIVREAEYKAKVEADTERYIVEVKNSKGEVYRTEEFVPDYYCTSRDFCSFVYRSSRQLAEQYVDNHNSKYGHSGKLVQFGDEYICKDSITGVKLVKVK